MVEDDVQNAVDEVGAQLEREQSNPIPKPGRPKSLVSKQDSNVVITFDQQTASIHALARNGLPVFDDLFDHSMEGLVIPREFPKKINGQDVEYKWLELKDIQTNRRLAGRSEDGWLTPVTADSVPGIAHLLNQNGLFQYGDVIACVGYKKDIEKIKKRQAKRRQQQVDSLYTEKGQRKVVAESVHQGNRITGEFSGDLNRI
ncbi:MAG: hypothetical protein KKH70_20740 [Gammaproteobacteria bacterium]|nr:hypothetical protein [Gammaproteobacteria bacterium]MBU2685640.1 hypothetical protein [Gammaproteobacteria bacterium]